jgi:pimeloyl-ACP methyl ester carboxylesterase
MPRAALPTKIELEYETFGSVSDPTLLLVSGFTAQLTMWNENLCRMFADRGHHVVRFDNRDCGLSTKLEGAEVDLNGVIGAAMMDEDPPAVPYLLADMANDAIGLLDHLGVERAHVMGASMGGMIAQTAAINHPHRLRTLVSVMSQPGELEVGQPTPEAMEVIVATPPTDREAFIESAKNWQVWHSKKYRDLEKTRRDAARDFDRSFYPEGAPRQMAAIYASGRRTEGLSKLAVPTLVIHGWDDTLIAPDGGQRTAELIPNAQLLMIDDMGHDLPEPLWPTIVDAVCEFTARH